MAEEKKPIKQDQGIAIGIALGLMVGIAMDNIPIGLCIGVALGAAYEGHNKNKNKDKQMRPRVARYASESEHTLNNTEYPNDNRRPN